MEKYMLGASVSHSTAKYANLLLISVILCKLHAEMIAQTRSHNKTCFSDFFRNFFFFYYRQLKHSCIQTRAHSKGYMQNIYKLE